MQSSGGINFFLGVESVVHFVESVLFPSDSQRFSDVEEE